MLTIIDCEIGNIKAFTNIFNSLNIEFKVAVTGRDLEDSSKIILPGVGAFDTAMNQLTKRDFVEALNEHVIIKKKPFLGICIGMQILAETSEEGEHKGLGWIEGKVKKLPKECLRLPHMGWNNVTFVQDSPYQSNIELDKGFYFLHSYYFDNLDPSNTLSLSDYHFKFSSSVKKENITGVQFHPEKSHSNGTTFLKSFAEEKLC